MTVTYIHTYMSRPHSLNSIARIFLCLPSSSYQSSLQITAKRSKQRDRNGMKFIHLAHKNKPRVSMADMYAHIT